MSHRTYYRYTILIILALVSPLLYSSNAAFIGQQVPSEMVAGQTYPVAVMVQNTDINTWTPDALFRLGSINPQDNMTWGVNRIELTEVVGPWQYTTFRFNVSAPLTPGDYQFSWRMVQEGREWFGEIPPYTPVTVTGSSANTPPSISLVSPANSASYTAPAAILLSANAMDNDGAIAKVEFYDGNNYLGGDTNGADGWSMTWANVPNGIYSLTAKATDNAAATTTSPAVNISVTTAPSTIPLQGAKFISQTIPTTMTAGQVYSASVTMQNIGTAIWSTAATYRLGSESATTNWGAPRVDVPTSVPPGANVTFNFNIFAPVTPGVYTTKWRMVQEGVAWFGEATPEVAVSVYGPNAGVQPTDPLYSQQWNLHDPIGGINLPPAWNITVGASSVVVAVIDMGFNLNHPDLSGIFLPGYDFVTYPYAANDGDGRDSNPSAPPFNCGQTPQWWHGTHVAGIIGAHSNNEGVVGINWASRILPVRGAGDCGIAREDIADSMRWAAGLPVAGVPDNPNPARVLNLSLGFDSDSADEPNPLACSVKVQAAITDVLAAGKIIVAAAGNQGNNSSQNPARCDGVISVAATNHVGHKAINSNYGNSITISAPGGLTADSAIGDPRNILSTWAPLGDPNTYAHLAGTSMATPHVTGVISLMLSVNPNLTRQDVIQILKSTARPFPLGSNCYIYGCGAGIVDADAAVAAAAGQVSSPPLPLPNPMPISVPGITCPGSVRTNDIALDWVNDRFKNIFGQVTTGVSHVLSFTTGASGSAGILAMGEHGGAMPIRTMIVSKQRCDFDVYKLGQIGDISMRPSVTFYVGSGPYNVLEANTTYFVNVKNENSISAPGYDTCLPGLSCDFVFSFSH